MGQGRTDGPGQDSMFFRTGQMGQDKTGQMGQDRIGQDKKGGPGQERGARTGQGGQDRTRQVGQDRTGGQDRKGGPKQDKEAILQPICHISDFCSGCPILIAVGPILFADLGPID